METILITFSILMSLFSISSGTTFTVYEDYDRASQAKFLFWGGGTNEEFTINPPHSCMNFNFYNDKISSLDPLGGCIKIWQDRDCKGNSMIVTESRGCSRDLSNCDIVTDLSGDKNGVNWDNTISSISSCSDAEAAEPIIDNGDIMPWDLEFAKSNSINTQSGLVALNIYKINKHYSNYYDVHLCKHIDCKRQERIFGKARRDQCSNLGATWEREVSAVYPTWDCVQLFDQRDCMGQSIKFEKRIYWFSVPDNIKKCQADLSTCKLENGESWSWNDRARSIRNC